MAPKVEVPAKTTQEMYTEESGRAAIQVAGEEHSQAKGGTENTKHEEMQTADVGANQDNVAGQGEDSMQYEKGDYAFMEFAALPVITIVFPCCCMAVLAFSTF
eukprot:CAMPEP_0197688138 /NCGR_PEP_ID=MMETSP1338-20131121/104997_1 /TAXON_ID=43686 ORGANISM="Pelagodinium beii, Strain RCC1491" /NCGR_SAMPLE_ID=MMETSP1338 /ASSEMBLY_ACC=CAM_ASM_000754 /LENGTH=102 /DNA_ID=CAMNT_0043270319 /DNA_START=16 /DNA_END=321 /DNA_ORIENTATION=-